MKIKKYIKNMKSEMKHLTIGFIFSIIYFFISSFVAVWRNNIYLILYSGLILIITFLFLIIVKLFSIEYVLVMKK